jgi:hypothetical protein
MGRLLGRLTRELLAPQKKFCGPQLEERRGGRRVARTPEALQPGKGARKVENPRRNSKQQDPSTTASTAAAHAALQLPEDASRYFVQQLYFM